MARLIRLHIGQAVQRVSLVVLACSVAFIAFTSAFTIATLHDHDCTGDDCSICLVLAQAQAMLDSAATSVTGMIAGGAAIAAFASALASWSLILSTKTPVSEKVLLLI